MLLSDIFDAIKWLFCKYSSTPKRLNLKKNMYLRKKTAANIRILSKIKSVLALFVLNPYHLLGKHYCRFR